MTRRPNQLELMEVIHDLALSAPSGKPAKVIAANLRKAYPTFMQEVLPGTAGNGGDPENPIKAKFAAVMLVPFMREAESVGPLRWMATEMGQLLVPAPACDLTDRDCLKRFLSSVREFGEFAAKLEAALADDMRIDGDEAPDVVREGIEAASAIMGIVEIARMALRGDAVPPSSL